MTLVDDPMGIADDYRRAVPADRRHADHPEARQHRVLTRKMTMTPELMLAVGVLFVSVAFAAGYVTFEVLRRRAPGEATASRGRRGERPRDEPAARRRRAGSPARAREPVPAEVAEGHVAASEADGARRLSRPDGARRLHDLRARPADDPAAALRLFPRHDAAACSSAR